MKRKTLVGLIAGSLGLLRGLAVQGRPLIPHKHWSMPRQRPRKVPFRVSKSTRRCR